MAFEQQCRRASKVVCDRLLLALVLPLVGCATVSDRSQYILVDSKPRGLQLSASGEQSDVIGNTPLIMRSPPKRSFETHILIDDERTRKIETKCEFAWGDLLFGNMPLAAALGPAWGGVYFGVAVATDLFSEAAYSCPERVGFDVSDKVDLRKIRTGKKQCRIIVAAPPYHFQAEIAEEVFKQWADQIKVQLEPCDSILELDRVRSHLAKLDITFDKPVVLRNLTRMNMNQIGLETGATHFADLEMTRQNGQVQIETMIYDIRSSDRESTRPVSVPALQNSAFYGKVPQVLDQSFYFLPNTLEFSSVFAFPNFQQEEKSYKFFREDEDKDVLSILANWELTYVPRPSAYPTNTFWFLSSPSFWTQLVQRKMNMYWRYSNIEPEDGLYSINERLNLLYLGVTQEARLYVMFGDYGSPFVGAGAGLLSVTGSLAGESSNYAGLYGQAYAGYLVETGPSVFLEFQGGLGATPESHFSTRFAESKSLGYLRVKAGFYLFEMREKIRSWM